MQNVAFDRLGREEKLIPLIILPSRSWVFIRGMLSSWQF